MTATTFKTLTPENLLEPDPLTLSFANAVDFTTNELREMTRDEFLSYVFEPALAPPVPEEVRNLFEAARGAMCYGYFFYPLFMLGFERCCGAGEAAVRHRARRFGATDRTSFFECVALLVAAGMMPEQEKVRWDAIRTMRNQAAHPKFQQIMTPGPCISMLPVIATAISELFVGTDGVVAEESNVN